jgi:hypothetical protein
VDNQNALQVQDREAVPEDLKMENQTTEKRLETATNLLERISNNLEEAIPNDPTWWRDYFLFSGDHMILTEEGWERAEDVDSSDGEVEILDEVNAPSK